MSESQGAHEEQKEVDVNFHISVEMGGEFTLLSPERAPSEVSTLAAPLEDRRPVKAQHQVPLVPGPIWQNAMVSSPLPLAPR